MDYGKRPYASPSEDYRTYMAEITDQYVKSIGGVRPAGLKRPYAQKDYNSMNYLFNTTRQYLGGVPPILEDLDWAGIQPPSIPPIVPSVGKQLLVLNFDGIDGATTWTEEAQGLVPTVAGEEGAVLDTSQHYSGVSCLRLGFDTAVIYVIVGEPEFVPANFIFTGYFKILPYSWPTFLLENNGGSRCGSYRKPWLSIGAFPDYRTTDYHIWITFTDTNGDNYINESTIGVSTNTWIKVEIINWAGVFTTIKIDNIEIYTITAPIIGINQVQIYNNAPATDSAWFDNVNLKIY